MARRNHRENLRGVVGRANQERLDALFREVQRVRPRRGPSGCALALQTLLTEGPMQASLIYPRLFDYSSDAVRDANRTLGVRVVEKDSRTWWALPEED